MTLNCSPVAPDRFCVSFCRDMALKFAEHQGISEGWEAQNFALFSLSRPHVRSFSLLGVFSSLFSLSGCLVSFFLSPGVFWLNWPPGLPHDSPRTPNVHISGPRPLKTPTNSMKGPRERKKNENCGGKREKRGSPEGESSGRVNVGARICREAGARVSMNVFVRDLDLLAPNVQDARRLEIVAEGLPLFGGAQLAVDTTLVSAHHCDGTARPGAAHIDGAALVVSRRRKERAYPELVGPRSRAKPVGTGWQRWRTVVCRDIRNRFSRILTSIRGHPQV